ncbi:MULTISPECIES: MFS transporter [unclassified Clostridium]|uniref:MFS transporter n=1 Tax=unclassified Clostridium TaxID=2614128 RepID=UPI0002972AC5|nr:MULTISPECIES: MFS transporter [unclassified Clostridium]EKQ54345.1 MAG: arabinose efflux permease family protein [Clostridium sp. Maddingley MBC34-26]
MNQNVNKKKIALEFILLFGLISALGDITYEGARSVYGDYLGFLGASAITIGFVTGFGEFLGYALRLISGYFIDKTGDSWLVTILGYAMLISVPLLALAGNWQIAALFIILERIGKAIRSPGKDTMLSHATKHLGTGIGFGISEALDQIGGFIGPLIFTMSLSYMGGYKQGFKIMWIPAILAVMVVSYTRYKVPKPSMLEENIESSIKANEEKNISKKHFSKNFLYYSLFIFFSVLGFANFPIISYHLMSQKVLSEALIPTLYAIAMAVDGVFAIFIGKYYDEKGLFSLMLIPILSVPVAILGFSMNSVFAIIAIILWGCVMSIHETIMKAAIADITTISSRGKAYGLFNTIYGIAMLLGSTIMGYLYEYSPHSILIYVVIIEILALVIYIIFKNNINK